jgi:diguanylate cyclase (GGDEF)-like protein/PAS domain S-box-containing protein
MPVENMSSRDAVRVLIAEDVATDAELSVRELRRAGMRIDHRVADTGDAFRRALTQFAPHVILSDFNMPQFDGMQALDLARELVPDTPFIFVSGTLGEEYAIRALKSGATDYVLKTNLIRLPPAVERALEGARARAARRRTEAMLAEMRERLTSMMETLPDVLWSSALGGERILYVSPAVRRLYGRDVAEFQANPALWYEAIHPEDRSGATAARRQLRTQGAFAVEYRILRPDGSQRWLSVSGRTICDAAGTPQRVDGVARDVTEQVEQRHRLARLGRIRHLLGAVNGAIVRERERDALLETFCRIAVEQGGFQAARLVLIERDSGLLRLAALTDQGRDSVIAVVDEYNRDPAGARSLLAEALRSGRAAVSNDVTVDPRARQQAAFAREGINSLACLPFPIDGKVGGVLVLRARERGYFDDEELRLLHELTANLGFALELMEKQARLDFLAYFDPLTGLANRALLMQRLMQSIDAARAAGHRMALVMLDVERFNAINEAFGQAAGDAVLKRIARLAAEVAGGGERAARIGGNQFALLVPAVREAGEVGRLLERMAASLLDTVIDVQGREVRVAAKAGAAIHPEDGADAEVLVTNAEAALKRAKATGERYGFYEPSLNARVAERLDLEAKVLRAVERGEFTLAFQPKIELLSRRIVGMEALLRWRNSEGDAVAPADFVPVLEDTGLILQVGQWAMREAVNTQRAWLARGLPATRIAVNISAIQLGGRTFVDDVCAALDGTAGDSCALDLEITESLLMENIDRSLEKLRALCALGVRIALDDFGTGYSSLAYLSKLPIDTLKIDRGFIRRVAGNPEDTTIVSAMISLAHALDLKVVAEGVESEAQVELLRLLRCDQIQGYLYSRPLSGDEAAALLRLQDREPEPAGA